MMKLNGRKPPRYMKKLEAVKSTNVFSVNGSRNSLTLNFRRGGGSLLLIAMFPRTSIPRTKNPVVLMAHPNPIRGMRCETMIGRITPPMLDPDTTMPRARARWVLNQGATAAIAMRKVVLIVCFGRYFEGVGYVLGKKRKLQPIALHTPCARKIW